MYYKKCKFGLRKHCGGLNESLETSKYIDEDKFRTLLSKYRYYAFDERCNQLVFIHKSFGKKIVKYDWLFVQFFDFKD